MSRNSGYSRNKKSQPAKPYNAANSSFVKRWTSRVSEYIPRLSSWLGVNDEEVHENHAVNSHNEVAASDTTQHAVNTYDPTRDEMRQEHGVPPQKRARTDFAIPQEQQKFSDTNNLSISAIQNDLGDSRISRIAAVPKAGTSGLHRAVLQSSLQVEPQAGPSGLHLHRPVASSTPAHQRPVSSQAYVNTSDMNGDNMSDSSESTSGCSSLVPQGGRSDSEQHRSLPSKRIIHPATSKSTSFGKHTLNEHRSMFNTSVLDRSKPQPAAPSKRPSFDISMMSAPSRASSVAEKADVTLSPFYSGKTCYGGASAYRKVSPVTNRTNISYDSIVNKLLNKSPSSFTELHSIADMVSPRRLHIAPRQGASTSFSATQSEPSAVSSVTKRILDTLETLSSPISDCSRIPLDDRGPVKRKRAADDLYEYHTPQPQRQTGPPITSLQVPYVQELMKMKQMQTKIMNSTDAARKATQPKNKPVWQENKVAYSLRQEYDGVSKHTNKMKRKQNEDMDELPEEVHLPNIALPISNLPKFDLPPFHSTPVLTSKAITDSSLVFTFSPPIVVKDIHETPSKNNLKLGNSNISSSLTNCKPVNTISEAAKFNWQSSNNKTKVNITNIPSKDSGSKSESKHNGEVKSPQVTAPKSLSEMFKPEAGTWECGVCAVRNKKDATACVACASPCPPLSSKSSSTPATASKASSAPSLTPKSSTVTSLTATSSITVPITSGFGAQFSRAGKWECSGCMTMNDNSVPKCPCCDTPNPKAVSAPAPLGFGAQFSKAGKWECSGCMTMNENSVSKCPCCDTPNPKASSAPTNKATAPPATVSGFGDKFKKAANSWECSVCLVVNNASATQCVSCESHKDNTTKPSLPKSQFSFGVPATSTPASTPSSTFKFGVPEAEKSDKLPEPVVAKFASPKPFTFGIPATPPVPAESTTSAPTAAPIPTFSFSAPKPKPEEKEEKKFTFPTPPKSEASPSLKRSAEESRSFQFGSATPKESPKSAVLFVNQNSEEEPASKKSFTFSPVTSKTEESAKPQTPLFMFGSSSKPDLSTTDSPSFSFKPASTPPNTSAETKPSASLFSFGSSNTTAPAGTGFSSPSFGASKPAEKKIDVKPEVFTSKTTEPTKPFGFTSPATESKGFSNAASPLFGDNSKKTTTSMFGAPVTTSNATFGTSSATFGSTSATLNPTPAFGVATSTSTPAFGSPATTAPPAFGTPASSAPSFTSNTGGFGKPDSTSTPAFGTTKPTAPMFGSPSAPSTTPAFGSAKPTTFGTPQTANTSMFGASNATSPMFGSSSASPSVFGAPTSTTSASGSVFGTSTTSTASGPVFGASTTTSSTAVSPMFGASAVKSTPFGEQAKTTNLAASATPSFGFGSKPTAPTNSAAPAAFQFSAGSNASSTVGGFSSGNNTTPSVGGFAFGGNSGAPANANQPSFGFGSNPSNNNSAFGNSAPSFPAIKPAEPTSMFGFGSTTQPAAPAPAFGATNPTFGETNNTFQTPNFGFGGAQPAPAAGFNFNANQSGGNPGAAVFAFGQGQQQQQQQGAPPQFNPNIRPTFNFTSNTGTPVFSAQPTPQSNASANVQQRRFKRATRRMQPPR